MERITTGLYHRLTTSAPDFLHHTSQSQNPPLPALHIQLLFLSKESQSLFPISPAHVFSLKICCSKIALYSCLQNHSYQTSAKMSEIPFKSSGIQNFTKTNQNLNYLRLSNIYIGIVSGQGMAFFWRYIIQTHCRH